jgi:hypothetical protein
MNNPNGAAIGLGNGARANTRAVGVTGSMVRNLLLLLLLLITMILLLLLLLITMIHYYYYYYY